MYVIAMQHAGKTGYLCSSILQRKESFVFMMSYNTVSSFVLLNAFHFKNSVFMCMCVFRPRELQCPQKPVCHIPWNHCMWELRIKSWSFGKAARAQIHWAISPAFVSIFLHTHTCVREREKGRFSSLSLSIYSFEIASPMKPKVYFLLAILEVSMPRSFSWPHLPLSWVCRGVSQDTRAAMQALRSELWSSRLCRKCSKLVSPLSTPILFIFSLCEFGVFRQFYDTMLNNLGMNPS